MKKKTMAVAMVMALLVGGNTSFAAVNDAVHFEGNDSNTSIESEHHEGAMSDKIDNPQANGEYFVANGAIKVTTDAENKIASVEVVDENRAVLVTVHVKAGDGFNCYISSDGLGASGLFGGTNKHGKIQEISHITVFYHEVHVPEHEAPKCEHDAEIKHTIPVGENTTLEDGKIEVTFEDGFAIIKNLDKCLNIDIVHGNEHYDADDSGYIKVPADKVDEIEIFISVDETCKPDVTPDVKPQEPSKPEEPKLPEFLPETGLQGLAYGVVGLGLAGLGVAVNKKRK